ncbi:hypothetical protein [Microbacterium sp. SORGH_AS_0862]|uniref:hypothetical protein n=1 Tax=Microbacterium sp. SORGH_AS_0862 TaxID=3041789 RepID=UPI002793DE78|nr:hypothetical protein [Microbacterium sp. SORGH_AS_0862]MDQ1206035.1 ABC-type multidrug transport system fused ATPase/permease subunit [Microbacterium sp. SORGH_AS_0862]
MVVAHRLATVVASDKIFVIERGEVVAEGTRTELAVSSSLYQDLAANQLLI